MLFFTAQREALDALEALIGDIEPAEIPMAIARLADARVDELLQQSRVLAQGVDCVRTAAAGVVAARSTRDAGHGGMAQVRGHRNAVSLVQDVGGLSKGEAVKQVRLGEAMLAATAPVAAAEPLPGASRVPTMEEKRPWHAVLTDALLAGALTKDQHHAILRGLGEPSLPTLPDGSNDAEATAHTLRAWEAAAEHLIAEAAQRSVEELAQAARTVRDVLDPAGCQARFDARYAARAFRMWADGDGGWHARLDFDDETGAFFRAVIDTALRPRRGGPRFVDADEAARAKELEQDPRTNDQLAYDLVVDVFRAGALADADTVLGTKQAGVRLVVTRDALDGVGGAAGVAVLEDDSTSMPAWLARQRVCDTGVTVCTVDVVGNPLDVGREERLYTPKQRIALAVRDGGCRWPGCNRPASYAEAHHIDPWSGGGRTDLDRGILLCRYHHMHLHHHGWRMTRKGGDEFVLHPPPGRGDPVVLTPRLARRYAFGDLKPPPQRFRPVAA